MHSGEAKIADLVKEYLQTREKKKKKKKTHNGMGKVEAGSRKEKEEEEGADLLPPPFRSVF
jgi:type IV secretory pathway TraG/TraD family ATPase VirD4